MTKQEKLQCDKLADEAIRKFGESAEEYKRYTLLKATEKLTDAEIMLRNADQDLGYAQGIYQALVCIGYKDEKMERLTELL